MKQSSEPAMEDPETGQLRNNTDFDPDENRSTSASSPKARLIKAKG